MTPEVSQPLAATDSLLEVESGAGVDPAHRARLEALVSSFSNAVALEMRCELTIAPTDRAVFGAHFPTLNVSLERWNAAIDLAQGAPEALWRRFARSARDRGITEPPFMVGVLIDDLATWTVERCRRWELDIPHEAALEHFNDRLGGSECVSVYMMGRRVATLPGGAGPDVQRRIAAADSLIQALFDEARTCEEANWIVDTRDSLLDLKHQLLDDLEVHKNTAAIRLASGCPQCFG
jgi:hypothetical protein